jgi:hypothetical protein
VAAVENNLVLVWYPWREDGKLLHNRVERSSWELFQRVSEK